MGKGQEKGLESYFEFQESLSLPISTQSFKLYIMGESVESRIMAVNE